MAILNVTEYATVATDWSSNKVLVGLEPALARQNVTYTTSVQSNTFHKKTRFIRVIATADAYLDFGASPTGAATSTRIEANVAEYFGVELLEHVAIKVAAYDGSS